LFKILGIPEIPKNSLKLLKNFLHSLLIPESPEYSTSLCFFKIPGSPKWLKTHKNSSELIKILKIPENP
jgi:hypothetical protein